MLLGHCCSVRWKPRHPGDRLRGGSTAAPPPRPGQSSV